MAALVQAGFVASAHAADDTAPQAVASETGRVSGVVVRPDGFFVTDAQVEIDSEKTAAVTDASGRFSFDGVPAGPHTVTVTYIGSPTITQTVTVGPGQPTDVRIVMATADASTGKDIVVTGSRPIAESEEAALQLKRSSNSIIEVVSANALGQYSDSNVAASVARLPGVGVQRDQGEARYVSIRGAPNNWTTLAVGGVNVVSPEGREARFDTIPSELAGRIIVKKEVTPDMPGETVAGNVDIIPRSAFDYPHSKILMDGAYGFDSLGGGREYNVGGVISTRFAHDTLGILVTASRQDGNRITDNFETAWEYVADKGDGKTQDWADHYEDKFYRVNRATTSFSGRLEWRPDSHNKIALSSVMTQYIDKQQENKYEFIFSDSPSGYANITLGNTPMKGFVPGVGVKSSLDSDNDLERIYTHTLSGEHDLGTWRIKWVGNLSRSNKVARPPFGTDWVSSKSYTSRPAIDYDFTDPDHPQIDLYTTVAGPGGTYVKGAARPYIGPTELTLKDIQREGGIDRTDAFTAKTDIDHDMQLFGADTTIRFGAEYDRRTKTSDNTLYNVTPAQMTAAGFTVPTQGDFSINTPYKGGRDLSYSFKYFSNSEINALNDKLISQGVSKVDQANSNDNNYLVREEVIAGYAMGTTTFGWGNIIYGARVENVKDLGTALINGPNGYAEATAKSSTTLVFPSFHINWNVDRQMKLRFSLNTGAARPEYATLRPNYSYDDSAETVTGGNPDAKPERSKGVDLYYEWYMPSTGFLSIGAYYKKLSDVLFDYTLPEFGSDVLNSAGVDRSIYKYTTTANGGRGTIKGIEINYRQPLAPLFHAIGVTGFLDGFGLETNLTFNDSKALTPDNRTVPVQGASKRLFNFSVFYEKYGLSARMNYTFRSTYLDSLGDAAGDEYWASNGRLDASVEYQVNPRIQVYFDATNLTNEPGVRFIGDSQHQAEHEIFGRKFMWGLRTNF